MTLTQKQQKQQRELHGKLWTMVNDLRGNMEAYEFKNYILGVIFYRYLSERTERFMARLLKDDNITYEEAWKNPEYKEALIEEALESLGFVIEPQNLFSHLVNNINTGDFTVEAFHKAINDVVESTLGQPSQDAFDGLFEDMDLTSTKLGREVRERGKLMGKILSTVDSISFDHEDITIDVLGDAYMYLIGMFAQTAGKKGGEFYTPQSIVELVARIATQGRKDILSVSDPTCGSGGLLLETKKYSNVRIFDGAELTSTTYNLCRMNMIIHNVPYTNFNIANTDTLERPAHMDKTYSVQVANPPYSAKWSADAKFMEDDRFSQYGKLAPKSKADFAFVQHMVHQMDEDGIAVVLLPHGVLFRGAAEGTIREHMIKEQNVIDTIIGLPAGCFMGTSIPVACLVLKKNRDNSDNIFFIDASKEFIPGKPVNALSEEHIEKILETYVAREDVERYASKASMDTIAENGYNLNIPRYVDTFEKEEEIDIQAVKEKYVELETEAKEIEKKIEEYFAELGI
ncbi:type I restriction-modification system subunit M [Proteiniclasticum sp. SCR006]|uniref:site-specific DNA-methyltransferase (adenine-specific) n=1 Tax=Proteiniclasticum aestuarii TaxID=2817862 RepID=A0A939HA23_9CLOT|nr:type I restriction-modification system subunit M [Proteiniclasticum aestuarii]MBO1264490.1 type I restriction-modification system subunit M [Proteiniclasticum aestuarii]